MSVIVHGATLTRQPDRIRIGEDGVVQTIRTWRGTRAACLAMQGRLRGVSSEVHPLGAAHELAATYAGDPDNPDRENERTETWTLTRQELRRSLATHPTFDDLTGTQLAQIEAAIRDGTAAAKLESLEGAAKKYLAYRLRETDVYVMYTPVIRRTLMAVRTSQLRAAAPVSAIPRVVATNQIPAPAGILFRVPANWQWLAPPEEVYDTNRPGIFRIQQEWIGAEKWADLYQGGTEVPDQT